MVTRAGKKLLKNTIHTVDHHNKVLEEQDMWRQWELQQGLTMMVSDDAVQSHTKYLTKMKKCLEQQKSEHSGNIDLHKKDVESLKKMRNYWLNKLVEAEEKDPDRWGHSGFKELYPEEFKISGSPVYSQEKCHKRKKERKKRKHKKKLKKSLPCMDCSEKVTRSSHIYKKNGIHRPKELKKSRHAEQEESSETTDSSTEKHTCKKLKRKHHSLSKCAKCRKKNRTCQSTSKKTENIRKSKKSRHVSESSVEEVWVERTLENKDNETPYENLSVETHHKLSCINNSPDRLDNTLLINSPNIQNRNMSKS